MGSKKTVERSKLFFNQFRVYQYSDGTFRFENYRPYFNSLIECITWGRAYQEAEKQYFAAKQRMEELQAEAK